MLLKENTVSVITGAGSGLGRALAIELARRRAVLILADIDMAGLEETQRLCDGAIRVALHRCDVTLAAQVEALAHACGDVDLVVNNAGIGAGGRIGEFSLADWKKVLDVDLWGVIHGCHFFAPKLAARGRGHFLNVASMAGIAHLPNMAAYNVAKAGVIALSDSLAGELVKSGVGVTALCPTFFKTNIARDGKFSDAESKRMGEHYVNGGKTPGHVARAAIAAVENNDRFCVPMLDAQLVWRLERLLPGAAARLAGRFMERL